MQLEGKRILVTGGAGFIGSHLVDALALAATASDASTSPLIRVLDDFSTGREENLSVVAGLPTPVVAGLPSVVAGLPTEPPAPTAGLPAASHPNSNGNRRVPIEIVRGDIRDPQTVAEAMQGIDVVFHLACRGVRHSIGHPAENHEVNAGGTLTLLAEARRVGVARFVHVSSSEVYGTARRAPMDEWHPTFPETVYGAAKLAGECYARAYHQTYGLPTVVVRPFNNFGPRSHYEGDSGEVIPRFVVWALNGRPPVIFGDGRQTRDFIYVEETVHWLCRAAECDALRGETINLASGRETSVLELAEAVYDAVGLGRIAPQFAPPRPGDVRRHLADVQKARDALGFHSRIGLAEGIARLVAYMRNRPEDGAALLARTQTVNWATNAR